MLPPLQCFTVKKRLPAFIVLAEYIERNKKGLVQFQAEQLSSEVKNDPFKKSSAVLEIVEIISHVRDPITRNILIPNPLDIPWNSPEMSEGEYNLQYNSRPEFMVYNAPQKSDRTLR